eukprot:642195-Pleurochrysis_carterae.AAC.3
MQTQVRSLNGAVDPSRRSDAATISALLSLLWRRENMQVCADLESGRDAYGPAIVWLISMAVRTVRVFFKLGRLAQEMKPDALIFCEGEPQRAGAESSLAESCAAELLAATFSRSVIDTFAFNLTCVASSSHLGIVCSAAPPRLSSPSPHPFLLSS